MKTDRELLELAAKAAGYEFEYNHASRTLADGKLWNPLQDDGQAFRLAVSLKMELRVLNGSSYAEPFDGEKIWLDGKCPLTVTRRAIVMAAADIGDQL